MKRRTFVRLSAQLAGGAVALPLLPGCGGGGSNSLSAASDARRFASGAMAAPGSRVYHAASGGTVYGGRFGSPLLQMIAAAPENSWVQLNTNLMYTIWAPDDFVPLYLSAGPGSQSSVVRAWSSFAWDPNRSRLIIYGGGHANYDGNEVYVFDGTTRQWSLGFYPSDVVTYDAATAERVTVDGPLNSPVSAHTYDNTAYLEILDRYVTFGGACAHSAGPYGVHDNGATRASGPYTLDLTQAGQGKVGGLAGSNVHRATSAGINLPGASAWAVRDYYKDHPDPNNVLFYMTGHIGCGTAYTQENGHDVIYFTSKPGLNLHRLEFVDGDYRNDIISRVGVASNSPPDWEATVALDPVNRVILILGHYNQSMFWGWDISGAPQANFLLQPEGLTGPGAAAWIAAFQLQHGIDFDPINNRFVMWSEGGQVFGMHHLGGALTSNWYVEELGSTAGTAGVNRPKTRDELDQEAFGVYSKSDTSVNGKWKWARDLNAFVGLQHCYYGNVWVYKPNNWVAPSG